MKQITINRISKIYKIYMAVLSVIFGLCFATCVLYVYYSYEGSNRIDIYDIELVKLCLTYLLIPFILEVVSVIAGGVFFMIHPVKENELVKPKPLTLLAKVKRYQVDEIEDPKLRKEYKNLRAIDIAVIVSTSVIICFNLIITILFLFNKDHYVLDEHIIDRNINLVLQLLPFVVVGLIWGIAAILCRDLIAKRKIDILKKAKLFKIERKLLVKQNVERNTNYLLILGGIVIGVIVAGIFISKNYFSINTLPITIIAATVIGFSIYGFSRLKLKSKPLNEEKLVFNEHKYIKTENALIWVGRALILVLAITFIIIGVFNNNVREVLVKAINICTECIGLG